MNKVIVYTFLLMFSTGLTSLHAQIDGDNIFNQDQVISIDLTFPDAGFFATLTTNYNTDDNPYIVGNLVITDMTGTYAIDSIGVRLKGNSSYNHPGNKKSFKIDFNEFVTGQNYDGLKKLNFSNGFKDPSCIREKVFFDVCHAAGVPAPRSSFANVTMNGTPWGFYTVIEQIDDQFLDWAILNDDGNLFKAGDNFGGAGGAGGDDAADLVYYGDDQADYELKYELKTNEDINDWTDLIEFTEFINTSSDQEFQQNLNDHLELTNFLRSAALDNLFANLDSYTGSARNYYIYHHVGTDRWNWIKWDGNESFGSYANGVNNITSMALNYVDADRPLLERIFDDAVLYDLYLTELCDITENYFNSAYMDSRIDEIVALVQASVYADANKMYSNDEFNTIIESNITSGGGPMGGTTYGLKPFIAARSAFAAGAVDCSLFTDLEELVSLNVGFYPNPTDDLLYIDNEEVEQLSFMIVDIQGRVVIPTRSIGAGLSSVDVSGLNSGLYFARYTMPNGRFLDQKLMVR